MIWENIADTLMTAGLTAIVTAYVTAKANAIRIDYIHDWIKDIDEKVENHEKRLSKVEGIIQMMRGSAT